MTFEEFDGITKNSYNAISAIRASRINSDYYKNEFATFQKLLPSGRILDLGSGTGRDTPLFLSGSYDYVGVDYSEGAINVAKQANPGAKFQVMNLYDLEFPNESFDGFWSAAVYLHVPRTRMEEALEETRRVTKPGGIGFVTMKEGEGEDLKQGKEASDQRFFSLFSDKEFRKFLEEAGFEIVEFFIRTHSGVMSKDLTRWLTYFVKRV